MFQLENNFDYLHRKVFRYLSKHGKVQKNQRTNSSITAAHGYAFRWNMNYWPLSNIRKMYPRTGAAEVTWFLSGTQETEWINRYTSIWKAFEDSPGIVKGAYGYRWATAYGFNQINQILLNLSRDPSSRQQVLMSWHPSDLVFQHKNVPCPYTAVFNIIEGQLNCHLTLRSNDAYLGLPYDIMMYTILSNLLANTLKVGVGELFYSIAHLHVYENQYDAVVEYMKRSAKPSTYRVEIDPEWTIKKVRKDKDDFIDSIKVPEYKVKPEAIFRVKVVT